MPDIPNALPALILAAGLSTRMRAFKPLVVIQGKPLLHHVIDALCNSGAIAPVVIITGHNAQQIEVAINSIVTPPPCVQHTIFNPNYAAGEMLSSLITGIAALPPDAPAFLLAFADQPAVAPATIRALVDCFHRQSPLPPLVLPTYRGKRGHPVIISAALIPEIRALSANETLKTVVYRHLDRAALLPVEDASILEDLDTPEDLVRAQQRQSGGPA